MDRLIFELNEKEERGEARGKLEGKTEATTIFTFAYCHPSAGIDWFLPPGCRKSCLPAY